MVRLLHTALLALPTQIPRARVIFEQKYSTDRPPRKDIYGYQNGAVVKGEEFPKAAYFYRNRGVPPSIVSETRENHALLRRQMSPGFSDRSLREQESIVRGYVDLLIQRLRERCAPGWGVGGEHDGEAGEEKPLSSSSAKTAFDMRHWFNYVTYDIIGDLAFGESFSCLEQGRAADRVTSIEKGLQAQAMTGALKQLGLEGLVKWLVKSRMKFRRENDALTMAVLKRRMALKVERYDLIEGLLKKQDDWVSCLFNCHKDNARSRQNLTDPSLGDSDEDADDQCHGADRSRLRHVGNSVVRAYILASQES